MAQAMKIFFLIVIAGVALFVFRSGVVQKFVVMTLPTNSSSSTAIVSRLFPFLAGQSHE